MYKHLSVYVSSSLSDLSLFYFIEKKNDLAPIAFSFILHLLTDKYNNALVFNNAARASEPFQQHFT